MYWQYGLNKKFLGDRQFNTLITMEKHDGI